MWGVAEGGGCQVASCLVTSVDTNTKEQFVRHELVVLRLEFVVTVL